MLRRSARQRRNNELKHGLDKERSPGHGDKRGEKDRKGSTRDARKGRTTPLLQELLKIPRQDTQQLDEENRKITLGIKESK